MPLPAGYSFTNKTYIQHQYEPPRETIEQDKQAFNEQETLFKDWNWENPEGTGPNGEALPNGALGWKPNGEADYGVGLKGWWSKATNKIKDAYDTGYKEGVRINGLQAFTLKKTMGEEAGQKRIDEINEERKPDNENQAKFFGFAEAAKETFGQALWGLLDGLGQVGIATEQVLGTAGYTLADAIDPNRDVNAETFKQNWNASRMAYSGIFDASIYEEMNRRFDQGVRPELAAQEVMIDKKWTMWPELIGQVVFDPLNVVTAFTKAGQAIKIEKSVAKTFHTVVNPELAKILDNADELAKMDDAAAFKHIDELVRSQQGLTAAAEHADTISDAAGKLDELGSSYKLSSMTADGKVAHVANQTGEILMHVVNNSSPDEALEILRGMTKSVSKNPEEAAEGISTMMHFGDARALFSEAGNNTTVVLAKMMEKHGTKWLDDIAALKDNPAELTKALMTKLDDVGQEMFPSVSKMLEAEKLVKAGGEVTEATRKLAEKAAQVPESVKAFTRMHDAAQKVVGPINKAFIGAYMGWSPGYAFRNFTNNSLQLLIDYGPGVLLGNADNMFTKAEKLHGGLLQGAFSEGGQAASLFPEAAKVGENVKGTGVKDILGAVKDKGLKGPVLGMSQKLEANAAKRIIAKTYKQTFDKGVKAMTKALAPDLKAAGFSDEIIKKLPTYIMQNDGDATKVIQALRNDVQSGVIDLFNDIDRIDPKYKSFMEDLGKWDEYAETVLKAESPEAANLAAKKIFDDIAEASDYVYREARPVVSDSDKFLKLAEEKGGLPNTRAQVISIRQSQNEKVIQAAEAILAEADDLAAKLGLPVGSLKKARNINQIDGWGKDAAKEAHRLRDLAWELTNQSRKNADLRAMWGGYPEFFKGETPAVMDAQTLRDALWHGYDEVVSKVWGNGRDTAVQNVKDYLADLKAAGAEIPDGWLQTLDEALEGAKQYDNAMIGRYGELIEEAPMAYGTRTTQISALAEKYGISTASEAGKPLDKRTLQTINKYAEVNYKSLEEVPLSVAEDAFKKKAGKGAKAVSDTPVKSIESGGVSQLDEATEVPRSELPEDVSQRMADEAKRLADELSGGQAGKRTSEGSFGTTNVNWYRELSKKGLSKPAIDKALDKIVMDAGKDKGVNVERMKDLIMDNFKNGDPLSGTPPDLNVLKQLGADEKTLQEALDNFNDITKQDVTLDEAIRMSGGKVDEVADNAADDLRNPDLPYFNDAGELVEPTRTAKRIMPPPTDGELPTVSRAVHEQMEKVGEMRKWVMDDIAANFGKKHLVDKANEKALKLAERELTQKLAETKLISSRVAQANRDFTLLNYGQKSYWDVALAYLYPFHYWYKGTYTNWLKRVATNPAILGHYSKYKDTLATVHADMPEWWRYNINTNDLPGVNVENPLYFNLEATLWPLNGITGMDFNDPSKRVNWWTQSLDFANKFGPSTWTPLNMVTGLALLNKGEQEAGESWLGRLIPQTATIKAAGSLLGVANLETDPIIRMLNPETNMDKYEERRAQRALANMEQEAISGNSPYTREQIADAAYFQKGEIWEEAVRRSVRGRAPSQMSSFLFGVGFKGRTEQDMEIDKFFGDYNKLWTMKANLTPEEFKEGMNELKTKYPFSDTMLLSRRDGPERDAGLAYLVIQRIPPGKSSEISKAAGIDPSLMEKFYNDKGDLSKWSPADRARFMSGVMTLNAVLEIPPDMTRGEWADAKVAYSKVSTDAKKQFGENILDLVDGYYQAKSKSPEAGTAYLDRYPNVSQYMDWKAQRVMNSPLLSAYYGGANVIESYYRNQQFADIEKKLGADIFDVMNEYNDLKTWDPAEAKKLYNANKARIKQYYQMKDEWSVRINQNVAQMASSIPEGINAGIREDVDVTSPIAQNVIGELQPEQQMSYQEFQEVIPPRLLSLAEDYFISGERLPETAEKQLGRIAQEMGYYSVDDLLQAMGTAMYSQP
jgi:hypothetical protein